MALNPPETRNESPFSAIREALKLVFARPMVMGWTAIPALAIVCLFFGVVATAPNLEFLSEEVAVGSLEWFITALLFVLPGAFLVTPAWAGIYCAAFALIDGEPVEFRSFTRFQPYYWRIVGLSLTIDTIETGIDYVGELRLGNLYVDYVGIPLYFVTTAPLMLSLTFIVRHGDTVPSAVKRSVQLFFRDPWRLFAVMIAAFVIAASGFLAIGLGLLLTLPLYPMIIAILAERARPLVRQEPVWPSPYPRPPPGSPYP